jgi:hypothetical protein
LKDRLRALHGEATRGSPLSAHRKKPPRGPTGSERRRRRRVSCHGLSHDIPRIRYLGEYKRYEDGPSKGSPASPRPSHLSENILKRWLWDKAGSDWARASWGKASGPKQLTIPGEALPHQTRDKALAATWSNVARSASLLDQVSVPELAPDALPTIGDLRFQFHPTVHSVPCWAVRIPNGVDADLF